MHKNISAKKVQQARRRLLKAIGAGGGVAAATRKESWVTPVINTTILPAHATATFAHTCEIPISVPFEAFKEGGTLISDVAGTYTGTQAAAGPFFGDCRETGFQFAELGLEIIIEAV